jgi:hypothetical protein
MQHPSKNSLWGLITSMTVGAVMIGLVHLASPATVSAQNNEVFRTPAKQYAGAISVKLQLRKGFTEYTVPMWIKPDQAVSTLDPTLMKELGLEDRKLDFETVKMSGELLAHERYQPMKSEWAYVPDFPKSCCHGVIGQDILKEYEIRVVPGTPAHVEWRRLISKPETAPLKPAFLAELKKLFSLSVELDRPYVLNLQEAQLKFEGPVVKHESPIFSFFILPPDREIQVTAFAAKIEQTAASVGFKAGTILTSINGQDVGKMDRWLVEKYLRGEKAPVLTFVTRAKKEITFDFKSRRFELKK